jgi:hypothetical protein
VHVGRPVGGVTRGEVSEVVAFQCFEDFTTTRCELIHTEEAQGLER